MSDFTFVHAADIHLDSSLAGLATPNPEFSAAMRDATRRAFSNVVDLAIDEGAKLVVIAGDLYDGTWKDQSTGQFAAAQLARLSRAGIRTFMVFGNHDAESRVSRHFAPPPGVHRFSNSRCETVLLDDLGVAVHGRSYKEAATTDDIAATYCPVVPGHFNLALLHTSLDGHPGHARYAPCTLERLRLTGHDYWALGHVHERGVRCEHPHVVFSGNTQGRSVREGGAKGATVVRVRDGAVASLRHHSCDEVRFARAAIDAGSRTGISEVLSGIGEAMVASAFGLDDKPTAIRVTVKAGGELRRRILADRDWFSGEVQVQATNRSDRLFVESVRVEAADDGGVGAVLPEIAELLAAAAADDSCGRLLMEAVTPLLGKLPGDAQPGDGADVEMTPLLAAARAGDCRALLAAALASVEAQLAPG